MCNKCYQPDYLCNCNYSSYDPCGATSIDFKDVFYNKSGQDSNQLIGLGLQNGSSLKLVIETIDEKVRQMDVLTYSLPTLRENSVINTLKQFAEVVDNKIFTLQNSISQLGQSGYVGEVDADPVTSNGNYWYNVVQNKLKIKVNGIVKEIPTI